MLYLLGNCNHSRCYYALTIIAMYEGKVSCNDTQYAIQSSSRIGLLLV